MWLASVAVAALAGCCCPHQVAEFTSLLANTSELVTQELQLPRGSCAVVTNGRVVWDYDPREPDSPPPGV